MDAAGYSRMMAALLPRGRRLWPEALGGVTGAVIEACAESLARLDARAAVLLREIDPATATELLAEHEDEFGVAGLGGTVDERRARVVSVQIRRQGYRPADIIEAIAPFFPGETIDPDALIEIDHVLAAAIGDPREVFRFFVVAPSVGSAHLASAQSTVDDIAASHTIGHVIERTAAIYDDPHSLYDRDTVGA